MSSYGDVTEPDRQREHMQQNGRHELYFILADTVTIKTGKKKIEIEWFPLFFLSFRGFLDAGSGTG